MGLDMYLTKKHYIGNQYRDKRDQIKLGLSFIKDSRVSEISESVAYWRKANHIHNWFVQNVQDGEDNGKEYYVSEEDLKNLLDTVKKVVQSCKMVKAKVINGYQIKDGKQIPILEDGKVIEDDTIARELLPTSSGFFFGSLEYDQYYFESLKYTEKTITELLKEDNTRVSFYYCASW